MANFNSSNPGQWYYFDESNPELGGVCLRELSAHEMTRIQKITVKERRKVISGKVVQVQDENTELSNRLTWDYCITDWKNVQLDGKDLECTTENKVKMMKCIDFAKFISECLSNLVSTNRTLEEARLKNSGTISNGCSTNQTVKPVADSTQIQDESHPVSDAM